MVRKITIEQYRKLKNMELTFSPSINAISGTNGTCKTSLLHLISNAFQTVNAKCSWVNDEKSIAIISSINSLMNPKVESLTRGDKIYNDPAYGIEGVLFSVDYYGKTSLSFRRHNSQTASRYAIKPKYTVGTKDSLPNCPVIYLGLARLFPFGEYQNDEAITDVKKSLPDSYQKEISGLFKSFTNYDISEYGKSRKMGDVKIRSEFTSSIGGIDSNTISAGEDNLHIILTALVSLKYYYESINSHNEVESILLVDELDATLHPAFQIKLLRLFHVFSKQYKIQIVFTTHSITLLEYLFEINSNVIYLLDNFTSVVLMDSPDIYKIKMHLQSLTEEDIYVDKVIPIFSEDDEARVLIELLFDYYSQHSQSFVSIRRFFHFVHTNISAENLTGIFSDGKLLHSTMRSICILDGDHNYDLSNFIISLPSDKAPEQMLLDYSEKLLAEDNKFWTDKTIISKGYGKPYYLERIKAKVVGFTAEYEQKKKEGISTKGITREFYKALFNDNIIFFQLLFKHWLHNPSNLNEINAFFKSLHVLFMKVARYHDINPHLWEYDSI